MQSLETLAATLCAQEPIHVPGAVQNYAWLLAFDLADFRVTHASENCEELWDTEATHLLNKDALSLLTPSARHAIRGALSLRTIHEQREQLEAFEWGGRRFDVGLHCVGGRAVMELELASRGQASGSGVAQTRALLNGLRGEAMLLPMLQSEVKALRHLSGFDRVMVYRFLENGDGEVIAEALGPGREPYLGLRYPAYDIPAQARQIAVTMPLRVIADTHSPRVEILGGSGEPLDLTRAHCRGVSPVHIEYLKNMGVRASMSTSLVVGGKLWGLVSFHHYRPRVLSAEERNTFDMFGRLLSMRLSLAEQEQTRRKQQRCVEVLRRTEHDTNSLGDWLETVGPKLLTLLEIDGLTVVGGQEHWSIGTVPDVEVLRQLVANTGPEPLVADNLSAVDPSGREDAPLVAGAVVYPVHPPTHTFALFFRKEVIEEVRWGGNPDKNIEQGAHGPRLSPRSSFAEYRRTARGRCKAWVGSDLALMSEVAHSLLEVLLSSAKPDDGTWVQQRSEMRLLVAELNHRVKNTLALVSSLANQTRLSSGSLDEYSSDLQRRLSALALAHDLVGAQTLQWADLRTILEKELLPYPVAFTRATLTGPTLQLHPTIVTTLCLVLHELVSNAAKYGALRTENQSSTLGIDWSVDDEYLVISWVEVGLGPVPVNPRRGFGRSLIEGAIPHQLGGYVDFELGHGELRVLMRLPEHLCRVRPPREQTEPLGADVARTASVPSPDVQVTRETATSRVLVLEDNPVQALDVERVLREMGFARVDVRGSAAHLADLDAYDVALLDVHLGDERSFDVATQLAQRGVPIIFATGYGTSLQLPAGLENSRILNKPLDPGELQRALDSSVSSSHPLPPPTQ